MLKEPVSDNRNCCICKNDFYYDDYWKKHGSGYNNGRVDNNCCANCQNWVGVWMADWQNDAIIIGRNHYRIGNDYKNKGMGGTKVTIQFFDGRTITTDNLWHQSRIPKTFDKFPLFADNARFIEK